MQVLTRTQTAPPMNPAHKAHKTQSSSSSSQQHKSHTSGFSTFSRGPRSSDSTQHTTSSTLWSPSSTLANSSSLPSAAPAQANGTVTASDNVINRVAEKGASIFQYCKTLRNRLSAIPGLEDEIDFVETFYEESSQDPVSLLWKTFRLGYTLSLVQDTLRADVRPDVEEERRVFLENGGVKEKRSKGFVYKFIQSCRSSLDLSQDEIPTIMELYNDDTTGFVKFARLVSRFLDLLDKEDIIDSRAYDDDLSDTGPVSGKRTKRQHVVEELVNTERSYVQHLELLNDLKAHLTKTDLNGDAIHNIFLNLGPLLDFQRRFLIRLEQTNVLPEDQQDWGHLFTSFEKGFKVYEWYIANQKNCEEAAMRYFSQLQAAGGPPQLRQIVESPTHLTAFLLKPFQRLSKYPLLIRELKKTGDFDEAKMEELKLGEAAVVSILNNVNSFIKKEERAQAVDELRQQVEDWKGHELAGFGELLMHGAFPVQKATNQQEREYKIYLFEKMLLCCKEVSTKKQKLLPGNKPPSIGPSRASGKPKLNLKGRLYLFNLQHVVALAQTDSYILKLNWLVDEGLNNMTIRYTSEHELTSWSQAILAQRERCLAEQHRQQNDEEARMKRERANSNMDEFQYMQNGQEPQNPYRTNSDSHEGQGYPSRLSSKEDLNGHLTQQPSNGSLRSRSTTGESGPPGLNLSRGAQTRVPGAYGGAPLTIRTQQLQGQAMSPAERAGNSYFSPTADSPISSRMSSSSGMIPFPRQAAPTNGWPGEDSNRYTAPAPSTRALHNNAQNGYNPSDQRGIRAPGQSMPMHASSLAQTRLRSASSPDVHSQQQQALSRIATANAPPVPSVPAHLVSQQPPMNRSQTSTPVQANGVPSRYLNHSPNPSVRQGFTSREYTSSRPHDSTSSRVYDSRASTQTESSFGTMSPTQINGDKPTHEFQFKLKVVVPSEAQAMTLIVFPSIAYRDLLHRIDKKLQKATNITMATGRLKLQFMDDDDGQYITMQNDDDVQTVFDQWRDLHSRDSTLSAQYGEIVLYCNK